MLRGAFTVATLLLVLAVATSRASSSTVSPCTAVASPAWSPDGQQVAFYATRWPPPPTRHRNPNDILQALCTANADGTDARPLRYTACDRNCPDPPGQLVWLRPNALLFLRGDEIFRLVPGSKPRALARDSDFSFVTNAAGTRIAFAAGSPACLSCSGPVTILDMSGARVGTAGGSRLDNTSPSLSPDGTKVVFQRAAADGTGKAFGIWTAQADGSHLRQLAKAGQQPLWAPFGGRVAYLTASGQSLALRLIPAAGGKSRTLVPRDVENVFGWSPDGKSVAFELGSGTFGRLAVLDVATGKVRRLLGLRYLPAAVWRPDSSELLATSMAAANTCPSLYRVPVSGSRATLISHCPR